jgi:hypothetical protein
MTETALGVAKATLRQMDGPAKMFPPLFGYFFATVFKTFTRDTQWEYREPTAFAILAAMTFVGLAWIESPRRGGPLRVSLVSLAVAGVAFALMYAIR